MGHDRKLGHVQSMGTYGGIFAALVCLTIITVGVAVKVRFDNELINLGIAMLIATMKASLVVLWFMHGKYEGKVTWAFIGYPLIILALLLGGVFLDYTNRGDQTQFTVPATIAQPVDHSGDHGDGHGAAGHGDDGHTHDEDDTDHH